MRRELVTGRRWSASSPGDPRIRDDGEAGVGKSALLEDARERASDMQVLSGSGIESEAELAFAALDQLLRPVLDLAGRLPTPQAGALRGALGLQAGESPDRFLVSLAVLSLLAETAERGPLLCLVDDAQWVDGASADALMFAARRLELEGIVLLFAAREGGPREFEAPDLPALRLQGLDRDGAAALLEDLGLTDEARARLVEAVGGNPLALLELPLVLSEAQLNGGEPILGPMPVSARVEQAFLARVRELPDQTQTLLLVAAADDTGNLALVRRAGRKLAVGTGARDAAQQAGIARVDGPTLTLRHPLLRSAIYQAAPLSRRQAAHRALASVLDQETQADQRAWHRAAASVEPDPSVVEELEQATERARRRSGFAAASLALERAAALTTDNEPRARRLLAAAENAWFGGKAKRTEMLLEQARPLAVEPILRADIDRYVGLLELTGGAPANACRLLIRAATDVASLDAERALQLLNIASVGALYAGDRQASVTIAELARTLAVKHTALTSMLVELLVGIGAHYADDFERAASSLRSAIALEEGLELGTLEAQPLALLFAGRAAVFLRDDEAAHRIHREAAAQARASGSLGLLVPILPRLAHLDLRIGRLASAAANASEGLRLARETSQHDLTAYQLGVLALVAAHRGDEEGCRTLATESRELASAHGFVLVAEMASWAIMLLELGLGRTGEALQRARQIPATLTVMWAALDRIEAAARAGDLTSACEWLDSFEPWAEHSAGGQARAVLLHCKALLAQDEHDTEQLFLAALAGHAHTDNVFVRARTELAFGEFLRRGRRRVEAREHLVWALDSFETIGAELWAERARTELRASGQTARRREPSTRGQLTPQEVQIAHFVAQGLSNREVAAQLFLSPRTIAAHLRSIFRKLDISSRTQLARLDLDSANERVVGHGAIGDGG